MISHPNVKINLGLSILRRRGDGFHDIETIFLPHFGICDTLEIVSGDDWSRTSASLFDRYSADCIAQGISPDGKLMISIARREGVDWDPLKDLCVKAYGLLDEEFSLPPVKIFLEKNAPVGAGLGGGSSDCAFTLRMLNEMFSLGLSDGQLAERAARLGSDCAFFVYNRPMEGTGRGEILREIDNPLPEGCRVEVVVPGGISVSTAQAYRGVVPREASGAGVTMNLTELARKPIGKWKGLIVNDFEDGVFSLYPELASIKSSLYSSGALYASMSGSGSALYGIFAE